MSLCPGTRAGANVPGQTPLSRPVPGQNNLPKRTEKQEKDIPKQEKDVPKQEKDVLKQEITEKKSIFSMFFLSFLSRGTSRDGTGQAVKIPSRPVPSRPVPSRPVPWQNFELVLLSLCPGTMEELLSRCPFVPGQGQEHMSRDKLLCPGTARDKMNW